MCKLLQEKKKENVRGTFASVAISLFTEKNRFKINQKTCYAFPIRKFSQIHLVQVDYARFASFGTRLSPRNLSRNFAKLRE